MIIGSFVAAVPVQAFDRDDDRCEQRIRDAERDLHKAERRHGEHSRRPRTNVTGWKRSANTATTITNRYEFEIGT